MAGDTKIICPSCDKETVKGDKCTLCEFPLETFDTYDKMQTVREKQKQKKRDEEEKKRKELEAQNQPAPKKSFWSALTGK